MKNRFGFLPHLKFLPPSKFLRRFGLLISLLTLLLSGVGQAQTAYSDLSAAGFRVAVIETEFAYSIERKVFDLVNEERVKNGRQALIWIEKAASAARFHSASMSEGKFLGHADLTGRKVDDRAEQFGLNDWRKIGENVAWISGYADPAARVVECWLRSPGHRDNMLDASYRESGLGLAVSKDGKYYFTQVFVKRK